MRRLVALACVLIGTACTTGRDDPDLPDAMFVLDAARDGGAVDGAFPRPMPDTCTEEGRDATLGMPCASADECDDGCFCNGSELCVDAACTAGGDPCPDDVECTEDVCLEETDQCFHEPLHAMCADEDACNGYEVCDLVVGCRPASPLYCNDENACTVDSCDSEMGCVHTPRDLDGDGFVDGRCGGDDCDDDPRSGANIYPGAVEVCDNRRDDDCDGLRDYNDTLDCTPSNGTCDAAVVIPGPGTYSGSTAGLSASYTLACRPSGPDAVFRFTLTEVQDVRITVSGGGTGVAVALRPWAQCATGPDEKCSAASPPSILRRSLPAGEYAIIVKTSAGAPFDVNLMFGPPTPIPPVDLCSPTTMDVSAGGSFAGMFEEVEDDYSLSCHSGSWRDAAYRFTITEPKDVILTGSTSGAAWTPTTYLVLTSDCAVATAERACRSSTSAEIRQRSLPPGTYYVLLESSATDATTWNLTVSITDPAPRAVGDACTTAVDITSGSGTASLATAELDSGTSCGGTSISSRDVYFYFDLATTRDVTLTTDGAGFHYASIQPMCGSTGSELRCRSGSGPLVQTYRSMPAGRYYVAVATTLSSGTVTAMLTTGPPTPVPPNDVCGGAIEVGMGYSNRDTLVAFDDDVIACSGTGRPDAFYRITLATRRQLIASATRVSASTQQVYLTLRTTCTTGDVQCANGSRTASIDRILDPGTYYLVVEMLAGQEEDYTLNVFVVDPP